MQCFGEFDHLKGFVALAGFVELANVADLEEFVPIGVFGKYLEHLVLIAALLEFSGVRAVRDAEQYSLVVRLNLIDVQVACRRHECRGVVVDKVVDAEVPAIGVAERLKERRFLVVALLEEAYDLFGLFLFGNDGFVGSDELTHLRIDGVDNLRRDGHIRTVKVLERAVVTL